MFKKLMVALDGSPMAESALPAAADLVRAAGVGELMLVRVVEGGGRRGFQRADTYLLRVAAKMSEALRDWREHEGGRVDWASLPSKAGLAAGAILRYSESYGSDLIMLATHGRSGVDRWFMGSVAEKVLRGADVPVVLVPSAAASAPAGGGMKRLLVPLDGSEFAERAIPCVARFARTSGTEVTILHLEPGPDERWQGSGGRPIHGNGYHREDVAAYLASVASNLNGLGLNATTKVRVGRASTQIVSEAREGQVNLLVMSSHGHTGFADRAFGSTGDHVLRTSPAPVLLVRAEVTEATPEYLQTALVYRCEHCGRRTFLEEFSSEIRCNRCHYHLKACRNCAYSDGIACLLQLPGVSTTPPGNACPQFEFRRTRPVLH